MEALIQPTDPKKNREIGKHEENNVGVELSYENLCEIAKANMNFELTELGNAKRLSSLLSGSVCWVQALKEFVVFDGERWVIDKDGAVTRAWELLLDDLISEKEFYERSLSKFKCYKEKYNTESYEKLLINKVSDLEKHYKRSQSKQVIENSHSLFKTEKGITQEITKFDSKGWYIGCKNGVVGLRKGELVETDKAYLMMKSTGIDFDRSADAPRWRSFLKTIMEGDEEKIRFLQRLAGQMLIGEDVKDKLIILIGEGANGKSVFLDTLTELMGEYAEQSSPDLLTQKGNSKEYYLASLRGKRAVSMVESRRGDRLEESVVKMLVDSGYVSARMPYGRPFRYQPVFTPILCTNHLPYISQDPATWRRLIVVPFNYTIPTGERDPGFRRSLLREEARGIFNWMVQGAVKFYEEGGLRVPEVLTTAVEDYKLEFDNILHFMQEYRDASYLGSYPKGLKCRISELRELYAEWCQRNGYHAINVRNFRKELEKKKFRIDKSTGGYIWVYGIGTDEQNGQVKLIIDSDLAGF